MSIKKVRNELLPYVEQIFERRRLPMTLRDETEEGYQNVNIFRMSGKTFHRIIARAMCEKRNQEEKLCYNTTYWKPGVENQDEIKVDNPDFQFFIDYRKSATR